MDKNHRRSLATVLAEYIISNPKQEYGIFGLIEGCGLTGDQLSIAALELAEVGIIRLNSGHLIADAVFSSITLKTNASINAQFYVDQSRKSVVRDQVITLNAITASSSNTSIGAHMKSIYKIVGSPYGFTEVDWELVISKKQDISTLNVVLGYQFVSEKYDSNLLIQNLRLSLNNAIDSYNEINSSNRIHLSFKPLQSRVGEHLFNEIARDILSADIAIFDTSDLNPNVMIELGIALTSGVSVVPIRQENSPNPPSDISGQTWVQYRESAGHFLASADDGSRMFKDLIIRVMRNKIAKVGQID